MYYSMPFFTQDNNFRYPQIKKSYKTLEEALELVKNAVQGESDDELFYEYLISVVPTEEERNIIASIRDDEKKHNRYFRKIYAYYTGENIPSPSNVGFKKPESYIDGIKKAKFGELGAVEKYRDIRAGIPDEYFRDMVLEIITDELKHAHKYGYILYLNLENKLLSRSLYRQTKEFTIDELSQYDGSMGRPAYVAVNGIVYDVSTEATWGGASHFGLLAGRDLTSQFQSCHKNANILAKLPKVGVLKE